MSLNTRAYSLKTHSRVLKMDRNDVRKVGYHPVPLLSTSCDVEGALDPLPM